MHSNPLNDLIKHFICLIVTAIMHMYINSQVDDFWLIVSFPSLFQALFFNVVINLLLNCTIV